MVVPPGLVTVSRKHSRMFLGGSSHFGRARHRLDGKIKRKLPGQTHRHRRQSERASMIK